MPCCQSLALRLATDGAEGGEENEVMWPFARGHWVFQPPPCDCAEIETYVQSACALRDEMATWATPLQSWLELQKMPVLKRKPDSPDDDGRQWVSVGGGTQFKLRPSEVPMYLPSRKPWLRGTRYAGHACCRCGSESYHWTDGTQLFCDSCWSMRPSWP